MSVNKEAVTAIAHLARIAIQESNVEALQKDMNNILNLVAEMNSVNTTGVAPLAHPFDLTQRLRPDVVTEIDLTSQVQPLSQAVENGLYLVPKVID